MKKAILEAVNEMSSGNFKTLSEVKEEYSEKEIFDMWLRYEGILGYTDKILVVLNTIDDRI